MGSADLEICSHRMLLVVIIVIADCYDVQTLRIKLSLHAELRH